MLSPNISISNNSDDRQSETWPTLCHKVASVPTKADCYISQRANDGFLKGLNVTPCWASNGHAHVTTRNIMQHMLLNDILMPYFLICLWRSSWCPSELLRSSTAGELNRKLMYSHSFFTLRVPWVMSFYLCFSMKDMRCCFPVFFLPSTSMPVNTCTRVHFKMFFVRQWKYKEHII